MAARFIVLEDQYGRRDVMWKRPIGRHWLISETHNNVTMQYIHTKQTKAKSCSSKWPIQILVVGTKRGKTGGSQSRVVIGLLLIGPDS